MISRYDAKGVIWALKRMRLNPTPKISSFPGKARNGVNAGPPRNTCAFFNGASGTPILTYPMLNPATRGLTVKNKIGEESSKAENNAGGL